MNTSSTAALGDVLVGMEAKCQLFAPNEKHSQPKTDPFFVVDWSFREVIQEEFEDQDYSKW